MPMNPKEIQDLMPEKMTKEQNDDCAPFYMVYNQALTEVEAVLPQIIAVAEKCGVEERESICESIVNHAKETGQLKYIQVTDVLSIIRDSKYE